MPSPNKLPSYSAALPPESVCPSAPPQTGLTRLNTRAACPQPVGSATWRAGGGGSSWAEMAEGPPLALRGRDVEDRTLAGQGPGPTGLCRAKRSGGASVTPPRRGLSRGPAAAAAPPASSWASPSACATPGPVRRTPVRAGPARAGLWALSVDRILQPPPHTVGASGL